MKMNIGAMFKAKNAPAIPILLSHEHLHWEKIIKGIMNTVNLPDNQANLHQSETQFCTTWQMQNKYYSAFVLLIVVQENGFANISKLIKSECGDESEAEAIIIYWDNKCNDSRQKLDDILASLGDIKPEVCLLVCDDFNEKSKVSQFEANQWCVENCWELIELEPGPSDELDALDGDFTGYGFQRVQSALHANCWSNMKKVSGGAPLNSRSVMMNHGTSDEGSKFSDPLLSGGVPEGGADEEAEEHYTHRDDDESFEELFAQFGQMRLTAASMSREDRLDYAERIATAFLGALGGDDDEEADTGGENTPDAEADTFDGYTELINTLDNVKLDGESACQGGESQVGETKNEGFPINEIDQDVGTAQLLTDLGFPVIESEDSSESVVCSDHDSPLKLSDGDDMDSLCAVGAEGHGLPVKSLEEIEEELRNVELERQARLAAATEEILKEIEPNPDMSKKFRSEFS